MQNETYKIQLDDIFEGPMDLLVHLIKKNEVDIYDIPIALITDQFLQYLNWMKSMNIDFAGDFIVMAATLTQLKSRMLVPMHGGEEDEEDPRTEITKPLIEYLRIKEAAEQLEDRNLLGKNTFVRKSLRDEYIPYNEDDVIKVGLFELIDAFQKILDQVPTDHVVELTADRISVKDRIADLIDIFEKQASITFGELFTGKTDKSEIIVTFLAILEMVKLCLVRIAQHVQTGVIRLFYQ